MIAILVIRTRSDNPGERPSGPANNSPASLDHSSQRAAGPREQPAIASPEAAECGDRSAVGLYQQFDLDRGVEWNFGNSDRAARVQAAVAEDLAEQLARTVDNSRLPGEAGCGGDEADD